MAMTSQHAWIAGDPGLFGWVLGAAAATIVFIGTVFFISVFALVPTAVAFYVTRFSAERVFGARRRSAFRYAGATVAGLACGLGSGVAAGLLILSVLILR
jgi:hypothetical protein